MEAIGWLLALMLSVPTLMFIIEGFAGLAPMRGKPSSDDAPHFAVLMPAHDEALGISATIAAVKAQLRPRDRLLIVADNCADDTAARARAAGAEVVERFDRIRRGKGFALAAGREALRDRRPAVVIVLDADCAPETGALRRLAAEAARTECPVQARNLLTLDGAATPIVELSNFAFLVKNLVRQRGLQRLGAPAHLQGTGMAFPWAVFEAAPLANGSLAEDLSLGLDLALAGHRIRFCEDAGVQSAASSQAATAIQRTRWEHGSVTTAWRYAPRLARAAFKGRPALLLLALDLIVPPLALLALLIAATLGVELALFAATGQAAPSRWLLALAALFAATVALVWAGVARRHVSFRTLLQIPIYVIWKLPIYWRLLFERQRVWVRTSREA